MNPLNDGDWQLIYDGTGQPTILNYEVNNLIKGMKYRFKSAAINYVGEGANSTESTSLCAETPTAPGQPQFVSSTSDELTILWTAPADNGGSLFEFEDNTVQAVLFYHIFHKLASQSDQ
jgi:hypothetical protein